MYPTDQEEWTEIRRGGDYTAIGQQYGISPVIARLLKNREIETDREVRTFLYGGLQDLEDPRLLDSAPQAAALLHEKVLARKPIRIIGDYDVDGICSTYILYDTLSSNGAVIDYEVPDRIRDGFGLNLRLIEDAFRDGIDTILTCDNGIAALDAVSRAKELGMCVILTDHHEPGYTENEDGGRHYQLPPADLIVDPKKPGCPYPNKDLCGAGVAWKLMQLYESLYRADGTTQRIEECPVTMKHLPFAAIATITDVMKLTGENRILVKKGLEMLPDVENTGLRALLSQTGTAGRALTCYDVGFILGPCLNAGGRLDSAMRCIDLLNEKDSVRAAHMAGELAALNAQRKEMTEQGRAKARELIEEDGRIRDKVQVLYLPGIHESVAGIIASRIKDDYNRPVLVLTDSEDPGILKGSGRSIEAYNMFEALSAVQDVFVKFGGHAMAAGVSLRADRLEEFRTRINEGCTLTEEDLVKKVRIDMRLPFSYVTEAFTDSLRILEPYGPGNRAPLFAQSNLKVLRMQILGQNRNAVKLLLDDQGKRIDALWFGDADWMEEYLRNKCGEEAFARMKIGADNDLRLAVTYHPDINEFRGMRSVQIRIVNFR